MNNFHVRHLRCSAAVAVAFCLLPLAMAQQDVATASHRSSAKKAKHPGVVDDLDAIGTRNIAGGRLGDWYSLEREVKLGRDTAYQLEGFMKPCRDRVVTEYVNRLGQTLVRNSDAKVPFTIKVIDSEEVNSFALPGGFLYVNTGLLTATEDEAELAGILAHEIAHVAARHGTRQMTRSRLFDMASVPFVAFGGGIVLAARETVGSLTALKFSRNFEAEADYLGLEYMYKAGYDPHALISFFERLKVGDRSNPGAFSKALSTHPQTDDRIRRIQQEIARILPSRPTYIISTSEFDDVRSRLMSDTATRLNRMPRSERPRLRRRDGSQVEKEEPSDGAATAQP